MVVTATAEGVEVTEAAEVVAGMDVMTRRITDSH